MAVNSLECRLIRGEHVVRSFFVGLGEYGSLREP
jgi:hypothetical protein